MKQNLFGYKLAAFFVIVPSLGFSTITFGSNKIPLLL